MTIDTTDATLLARFLTRAAQYHRARRTNVILDGTTAQAIGALLHIPGRIDPRVAHALTPRQAEDYARQLAAVGGEVAA